MPPLGAFVESAAEPRTYGSRLGRALRVALFGTFGPLWQRFRLGEGGLLAINASVIWLASRRTLTTAVHLAVCAMVLALLYAFNDVWDVRCDWDDPKKDQRLVLALLAHRTGFFAGFAILFGISAAICGYFVGPRSAAAVIVVALVNLLYSAWLKRVPGVDAWWVGVWGGSYAAIADARLDVCLIVGLMTAISHVFQAARDRDVDERNRIATIALGSERLVIGTLAIASGLLALALVPFLGPAVAVGGLVPVLLSIFWGRGTRTWLVSKLVLASLWAVVIVNHHGLG